MSAWCKNAFFLYVFCRKRRKASSTSRNGVLWTRRRFAMPWKPTWLSKPSRRVPRVSVTQFFYLKIFIPFYFLRRQRSRIKLLTGQSSSITAKVWIGNVPPPAARRCWILVVPSSWLLKLYSSRPRTSMNRSGGTWRSNPHPAKLRQPRNACHASLPPAMEICWRRQCAMPPVKNQNNDGTAVFFFFFVTCRGSIRIASINRNRNEHFRQCIFRG